MIGWVAREGARFWLGKRVRVGAGCAPEVTMAEGVVIGYLSAPSVIVRDAHGRDSTWMVTLPIDVLGEVEDSELPERAVDTGSVWIVWDFNWMDHELLIKGTFATELEAKVFNGVEGVGMGWGVQEVALPERVGPDGFCTCEPGLPMRDCGMAGHREVARLLRQPAPLTGCSCPSGWGANGPGTHTRLCDSLWQGTEARQIEDRRREASDAELNQILRGAGIEHPLGLRGVRDLVNQRDGHLERAREANQLCELVMEQQAVDRREHGRSLDAVQRRLEQATARAEEAERRLANVREMVHRLRHAAGGGMTPGYALVRIEDMLNGQEPT